MRRPFRANGCLFAILLLASAFITARAPTAALADELTVPSDDYPTLQDAVDEAAVNGDPLNIIYLHGVVTIGAEITLTGADFGADRELIFRPVETESRATVEVASPFILAFNMNMCQNVTFRDLDIVRNTTNAANLIRAELTENCVFDRCRIGSIWSTPGTAGQIIMFVTYPNELVIRNCVFFAYFPGTFDTCLFASDFSDDRRSIYLYNNVFADHLSTGVHILGAGGAAGALVLLRNNVVVNNPDLATEPVAYYSSIGAPVTIETSHNVAFASPANVETIVGGGESISGETVFGGEFLRFDPVLVDDVFVERTWIIIPPWDPNVDFFMLDPAPVNPMHDEVSDHGVTVFTGVPYFRDKAVRNDIEQEGRPGGVPPHTDRGVDQLEPGISSSVRPGGIVELLWASPLRNPSDSPALRYRSYADGLLTLELFDVAGRRVRTEAHQVSAGQQGVFSWPRTNHSGVVFYRLSLQTPAGPRGEVTGKILVVK